MLAPRSCNINQGVTLSVIRGPNFKQIIPGSAARADMQPVAFYKWSPENKELRTLVRGCQRLRPNLLHWLPVPLQSKSELSGLKRSLILPSRRIELFFSVTRRDALIFNGASNDRNRNLASPPSSTSGKEEKTEGGREKERPVLEKKFQPAGLLYSSPINRWTCRDQCTCPF